MPCATLKTVDDRILHIGYFRNIRQFVEDAASQGLPLDRADLSRRALHNANLDDLCLRNGSFRGANLMGANLSHAVLNGTDFRETSLQNSCLAYACLRACRFEYTSFGATDLTGADIRESRFSGLSTFSLDFTDCQPMTGCAFQTPKGTLCPMTRPPLVLRGLIDGLIAILDEHIWVNHRVMTLDEWTTQCAKQNKPSRIKSHNMDLSEDHETVHKTGDEPSHEAGHETTYDPFYASRISFATEKQVDNLRAILEIFTARRQKKELASSGRLLHRRATF